MAEIQKHLEEFDDAIRLGRFVENAMLQEKRDIIRQKLSDKLPGAFEEHSEDCPAFSFRDQGSYELGTGIKPVGGDFDIDQGIYFELQHDEFEDPVDLKKRVHDALEGHTKKVEIRRSCVTVFYQQAGEDAYHVDLAIYREGGLDGGLAGIAKGKEHSAPENRFWEESDPAGLSSWVLDSLDETARGQLRRVVRYVKRWKDERFSSSGNAAPTGIALMVAIRRAFSPRYSDVISKKADDLSCLQEAVASVLGDFSTLTDSEGSTLHRLEVRLPVQPVSDLMGEMTDAQSEAFYNRLRALKDALDDAGVLVDPVEACERLRSVFGEDFPVPEPSETAAKVAPAILGSSSSA